MSQITMHPVSNPMKLALCTLQYTNDFKRNHYDTPLKSYVNAFFMIVLMSSTVSVSMSFTRNSFAPSQPET
jgi:hypothetical protein